MTNAVTDALQEFSNTAMCQWMAGQGVQNVVGWVQGGAAIIPSPYTKAAADGFNGTDTAACMEKYFPNITTVAITADASNVKITYPQDLAIAEHVLAKRGYKD